jgi:ABC-2 type transport system permease protein
LILASTLLFRLNWGDPLALTLLVLTLVAAATAWGLLIAAYSRTPGQAAILGTVLSLTFGIAAGNFIARPSLPQFLRTASLITPNAWGLEGFTQLAFGGGLADMTTILLALTLMAAVLFTLSTFAFSRQFK